MLSILILFCRRINAFCTPSYKRGTGEMWPRQAMWDRHGDDLDTINIENLRLMFDRWVTVLDEDAPD